MGIARKSARVVPDQIARLQSQLEALTARLENLEGASPANDNRTDHGPQSRRDLLKLAGAAAAGAAGSVLLRGVPAAAATGASLTLGTSVGNDADTTTDIWPSTATAPAPLFQATGQGVDKTTTVLPTASTTAPTSQSIPLIGAIGAGGSLPSIGDPPVSDYPGFAPIQGVGGKATITTPTGAEVVSEGVNGFGAGVTGIGVTGESDSGYGVVGGSGGIDIAALGNGRMLQLPLLDAMLTAAPAGPPNFAPNQFEQARDANGVLYISTADGSWVPVQPGGLNQALFTAVSTQQYRLNSSNGSTWVDMDATNLKLTITPLFDCWAILTANSDLWTINVGVNQDIGVFVSGGAYGGGQVVGWKESGGFFHNSPNAAFLQVVSQLAMGTTYTVKLQWKSNVNVPGSSIFAGAGLGPAFSPTRLTAHLVVNP
jgi:hypothetical protein